MNYQEIRAALHQLVNEYVDQAIEHEDSGKDQDELDTRVQDFILFLNNR